MVHRFGVHLAPVGQYITKAIAWGTQYLDPCANKSGVILVRHSRVSSVPLAAIACEVPARSNNRQAESEKCVQLNAGRSITPTSVSSPTASAPMPKCGESGPGEELENPGKEGRTAARMHIR
jgi:hypothetical protein